MALSSYIFLSLYALDGTIAIAHNFANFAIQLLVLGLPFWDIGLRRPHFFTCIYIYRIYIYMYYIPVYNIYIYICTCIATMSHAYILTTPHMPRKSMHPYQIHVHVHVGKTPFLFLVKAMCWHFIVTNVQLQNCFSSPNLSAAIACCRCSL